MSMLKERKIGKYERMDLYRIGLTLTRLKEGDDDWTTC